MTTILYNTTTNTPVSLRRYEGGYNAVFPNATLPNHIIELEVIDTPQPEYDSALQYVTSSYEKQDEQWVRVWVIHDKTEQQLIDEINSQAEAEANQVDAVLVNKLLRKQLVDLPEEELHEYAPLFPPWDVPEPVYNATDSPTGKADIRRRHGQLYKCIISHTTQWDWPPEVAVNLWNKVPEPGVIPNWSDFASHEFQNMEIGTAVMDNGTIYYLINPSQGHWQPSGSSGHHGWSTTQP